jgi:hypothetical protein
MNETIENTPEREPRRLYPNVYPVAACRGRGAIHGAGSPPLTTGLLDANAVVLTDANGVLLTDASGA